MSKLGERAAIPVVILASERSGSNLLRSLIGNHREICAPVAPHLMMEFYHDRKYYGDLRESQKSALLLNDMLAVANHRYHDWNLRLDVEEFAGRVNSVVSAFHVLYSEKSRQEEKVHYCSKGIDSFEFVDPLRSELQNVKFVHLVRDPRDHVASWMKRPISLLTPYDAILKWKHEQETFIDAVTARGLDCISIKYEDLISDAEAVMTRVQQFIGVEIDDSCFSTDSGNVESKRNPYWKNLSKPIMTENSEKFRDELLQEDIEIIETIAHKAMCFFGYKPITDSDWVPPGNFSVHLAAARASAKHQLEAKGDGKMDDLQEKWGLVASVKAERKRAWLASHPVESLDLGKFRSGARPSGLKANLKRRIEFIVKALLGEEMTIEIARRLK